MTHYVNDIEWMRARVMAHASYSATPSQLLHAYQERVETMRDDVSCIEACQRARQRVLPRPVRWQTPKHDRGTT